MYINRICEKMILDVSNSFPCIAVYGPRQVGKSTTINHLFGDKYSVVTLDDADDRALALRNPKLFLETYKWPVIIDEIQKAPVLLEEIKKIVDAQKLKWLKEDGKRELMYILTGSNRFELQEGIAESLAGRCGIIDMLSFSRAEIYGTEGELFEPDIAKLLEHETKIRKTSTIELKLFGDIFKGGMPDVCTEISDRDFYYKSYINTYIEKDIRKVISAGSEVQFRNFLELIALRTSQELRYDSLATEVGIDVRTCKRWISLLCTSGIIYLLQPYLSNISSRIIKAPKLYFTDTGLCTYLCKWPNADMLEKCAMSGALFETYIVSELIKNYYAHNKDPKEEIFYYRDIDQKEIDILIVKHGTIFPIEIKKGGSPKNPAKNFGVLKKYNMPISTGLIIDTCDKIRPLNEEIYYYPAGLIGM